MKLVIKLYDWLKVAQAIVRREGAEYSEKDKKI